MANKIKSITLFNPPSPWLISDRALVPLGELYLANYIRSQGIDVIFKDLSGGNFSDNIDIPDTDLYGVGFVSPQYVYAKNIKDQIKKAKPDAKVIAGGVHATSMPQQVIDAGFDAVIRGEGEKSIKEIITNGLEKKIYDINYTKDLNSLPGPAWDLIDLESYISNIDVMGYMDSGNKEEREINIMGTRGCPGACGYCTQYKGGLRWRTKENIMEEIELLQEKYDVNRISFCDDNLVVHKKWLGGLLADLKDNGIKWHCLGRADQVNLETCEAMADSGCMGIDYGIETGAQKMLNVIQKHTTVEKQERGIKAAYDAGLKVRAQLMVGLPQETDDDISQTLDFIYRNNDYVAKWGVHTFIPFPSCEIWDNPEKFKYNINRNTDFEEYQTIGKPKEWAFVPESEADIIHQRRLRVLDAIAGKNIYKNNSR